MPRDLRLTTPADSIQSVRLLIEKTAGDVLDVGPYLAPGSQVELARSEPSPDLPVITSTRFVLAKSYDSKLTESFYAETNPRFAPGRKVTIQIYWEGAWRSPPFAAETYIKFSFCEDVGTHETLEIETQGKLARVIEIDKAFDPERKYLSDGTEVSFTRDVLGTVRSLKDIINSYLHVKAVGPVGDATRLATVTTNASKEYLADTSDSEISAANQLAWYNPTDKKLLNFIYEKVDGTTAIASIPLDLSVTTAARRLFSATWGLYETDLLTFAPEKNVEQLAEYVVVSGVATRAIARPTVVSDGGYPQGMTGFSLNAQINPITNTGSVTTIDWAALTIRIESNTYSTASAIAVSGGGGGAIGAGGNVQVQSDVTIKYFDGKRRLYRKTLARSVPDAIKTGATGSSGGTIGGPAYQEETLYTLSADDKVLSVVTHQTAASGIAGGSAADPATLEPLTSSVKKNKNLGGGANAVTTHAVANIGVASATVPFFPNSYAGTDERAQPEQCEYFPDRYYTESIPLRRKTRIAWGSTTSTGRTTEIDVGTSLLSGQNFDLLAESLAHLHTARHRQYNCSFPMRTTLFEDWKTPGKVISVGLSKYGKRHHFYTGADSIKIGADSIVCETTLFWIGTTDETTQAIAYVSITVETQYILDEDGNVFTDENGDRLIWET